MEVLTLLICSITDIIWDFIPLFTAADYYFEHDGVQQVQLLLPWTLYTNELNVFQFIIICQLLYFPTYVHLCKYLIYYEIKNWIE